jgi:hypothetical protein
MGKISLGYIIYKARLAIAVFKSRNYIIITDKMSAGHQDTPEIAYNFMDALDMAKENTKNYVREFNKPSNFKYTGGKHE